MRWGNSISGIISNVVYASHVNLIVIGLTFIFFPLSEKAKAGLHVGTIRNESFRWETDYGLKLGVLN